MFDTFNVCRLRVSPHDELLLIKFMLRYWKLQNTRSLFIITARISVKRGPSKSSDRVIAGSTLLWTLKCHVMRSDHQLAMSTVWVSLSLSRFTSLPLAATFPSFHFTMLRDSHSQVQGSVPPAQFPFPPHLQPSLKQ